MSIRRMMLFTLGAKIKNLIDAFKTRVLADFGIFEAESCLNTQLTQLDNQSLLDNASLIVTPNAYKQTRLYSVVPNNTTGDMVVTRATTATRVNSSGLIENVAVNAPRIDYSNGSCPSILVEPQRTNVLIRSEELNITPWSSAGINVTPNTIISPSGLLNADTITGDGNLTLHQTFQTNISYVSGSTYTFSVYVKKGTNDFIQISLPNNTFFSLRFANFDINTGVIGNVSVGVTASILNAGNGWYRCIVTSTASATITSTISLVLITSSTSIRNENNSLNTSVNVWGAQLEVGTNVTSYIPTFASTVTRNADVISKTGISSLIGQTEGTMFADVKVSANKESVRALQISDGTIGNRIQLAFNGNNFAPAVVNGGVVQAVFPTPFTAGRNKLAIAYANNDVVAYLNGIQIGSDSLATIPLCNLIDVGHSLGGSFFNDEINFISLFKTRLTNTQLATLTTL
jgi:hypothetical protein